MHRGQRDCSTKEGMAEGARVAALRRGGVDHEFVIGGFRLINGRVELHCIECTPAYEIRETLTPHAHLFARWRTKQAAWQWLQLRPGLTDQVHVIHLGRLDVLGNCVDRWNELTGGQRGPPARA